MIDLMEDQLRLLEIPVATESLNQKGLARFQRSLVQWVRAVLLRGALNVPGIGIKRPRTEGVCITLNTVHRACNAEPTAPVVSEDVVASILEALEAEELLWQFEADRFALQPQPESIPLDADMVSELFPRPPQISGDEEEKHQQILNWLQKLLQSGSLIMKGRGAVELREEIVTVTATELAAACGSPKLKSTVRDVIKAIEERHWIVPGETQRAGYRLLGPVRCRILLGDQNIGGPMSASVSAEIPPTLQCSGVRSDLVRLPGAVTVHKHLIGVAEFTVQARCEVQNTMGQPAKLAPDSRLLLQPGALLSIGGEPVVLLRELHVEATEDAGFRLSRVHQPGEFVVDVRGTEKEIKTHPDPFRVLSGFSRSAEGELVAVETHFHLEPAGANARKLTVDWGENAAWWSRFPRPGHRVVVCRRAIHVELKDVLPARRDSNLRVMAGLHDSVLDAETEGSPGDLSRWLQDELSHPDASLRKLLAGQPRSMTGASSQDTASPFGQPRHADGYRVLTSRVSRLSSSDVLHVDSLVASESPSRICNELLFTGRPVPCWSQLGEYHDRSHGVFEVCLERYLPYVCGYFRGGLPSVIE